MALSKPSARIPAGERSDADELLRGSFARRSLVCDYVSINDESTDQIKEAMSPQQHDIISATFLANSVSSCIFGPRDETIAGNKSEHHPPEHFHTSF